MGHARLSRRRRALHPGAARPVEPRDEPAGQPLRHDRHGHRGRDDADRPRRRAAADRRRGRHRRRHRLRHRPAHRDDGDAAARRRLPQPRRAGGGPRRDRRLSQPRRVRHPERRRHRHRHRQQDRDGPRRRDRRDHLLRLDHRLPQIERQHERRADPAAGAPHHQHRAAARRPRPDRAVRAGDAGAVRRDRRHEPRARLPADHPDRRGRHAGRRVDAQQLFGLGGGGDGLHAAEHGDDHHRRAGRIVGRDPVRTSCAGR